MSASNTAWQQSPREFNTVTLHHVGSKFSSKSAREGHHIWRVRHLGTALPQPFLISPTYIRRRAKLEQCTHLMEPYTKSFYLYACSIKNCTHLHSEASSSGVLHQDISTSCRVFVRLCKNNLLDWWATGNRIQPWASGQELQMTFQQKQWRRDL